MKKYIWMVILSIGMINILEAGKVSSQDIELHSGKLVTFGNITAKEVYFGGYKTPKCKFAISLDGSYFYLKKMNSTCTQITNSKGVKIICNSNKKVCKTHSEIKAFITSENSTTDKLLPPTEPQEDGRWERKQRTVIDNKLNLMWQDDSDVENVKLNWNDAKSYCADLTLNGYKDWRLPNIRTLQSVINVYRYQPAIKSKFLYVKSETYWSSSLYLSDIKYVWDVSFKNGLVDYDKKSNLYHVRCVRDHEKKNESKNVKENIEQSLKRGAHSNKPHKEAMTNDSLMAIISYTVKKGKVVFDVNIENFKLKDTKGGLSISFPQLKNANKILQKSKYGFDTLNTYASGSKLWSGKYHKTVRSKYLLVEGWSKHWEKSKPYKVTLEIDTWGMSELLINVRALLLKNKKEIVLPKSGVEDQQGYSCKQIKIDLSRPKNKSVVFVNTAKDMYSDAIKAHKEKNYARSVELLENSCELGYVRACTRVAMVYTSNKWVSRDYHKALKYYSLACDKNYKKSCIQKDRVLNKIKYNRLKAQWDKEDKLRDDKLKKQLKASRTKDNTFVLNGLEWQDDSHVTTQVRYWNDANDYCKMLILSGKNDWRLPTIEELKSLDDNVIQSQLEYKKTYYWSSSEGFPDKNDIYIFDYKSHYEQIANKSGQFDNYVRCTRTTDKEKKRNEVIYKNDTVYVNKDALEWQDNQEVSIKRKWKDADKYCKNLSLNGKDDWRLPSVAELKMSAKEITYGSQKIGYDPKFKFKVQNEGFFWSSHIDNKRSNIVFVYGVNFDNISHMNPKVLSSSKFKSRCVRGKVYEDSKFVY